MCHNHSHLVGVVIGQAGTDQFEVVTIVTAQEVTVEQPTGARLILPASSRLFVLLPTGGRLFYSDFLQTVGPTIALYVKEASAFGFSLTEPRK